jgi:hypothetical protein
LIHRILEDKALKEIPRYKSLLEMFTNPVSLAFQSFVERMKEYQQAWRMPAPQCL